MLTPITAVALLAGICVHGAVDTTGQCATKGGACEEVIVLQMAMQHNHSQSRAKAIQSRGESSDAWGATITWLRENGATATDALASAQTHHGGAEIRGVVSTEELERGSEILNIPEHLWLHSGSVAEIQNANLDCIESGDPSLWSLAVTVALETQKGDASRWAPYLQNLPTLADYKSFFPRYASSSLLHEFRAHPVVSVIEGLQEHDSAIKKCFAAWQKSNTHLEGLSELTWDDMLVAFARIRTRIYNAREYHFALIPGSDFLNTASSQSINTLYGYPEEDHFQLRSTTSVPAGGEVYDNYCPSCSNDRMLYIWGVYLEDNPNGLASLPSENCSQLRQPVLAALNTGEAQANWTAPRCNAETLSADQGPLRCSLARLAWESCTQHWEGMVSLSTRKWTKIGKGVAQQSLLQVGKANKVDVLAAIHSSRIHGVHPSLVPSV